MWYIYIYDIYTTQIQIIYVYGHICIDHICIHIIYVYVIIYVYAIIDIYTYIAYIYIDICNVYTHTHTAIRMVPRIVPGMCKSKCWL